MSLSIMDRRQLLRSGSWLAGSLLAPAALAQRAPDDDDDDDEDFGYDLESDDDLADETRAVAEFISGSTPPVRFIVNPEFLPPVGEQGSAGSCVAWAAGYGLATYMLAKKHKRDAALPANQVSPAYLYGTLRNAKASGCKDGRDFDKGCKRGKATSDLGAGGTDISMALAVLTRHGSVSVEECPYPQIYSAGRRVVSGAMYKNIYAAWGATRAEPTMKIKRSKLVDVDWEQPSSLLSMKKILASNEPIVIGSRLPAKWKSATIKFSDGPWERYRDISVKKSGQPSGHAMLVLGYDDEMESAGGSRGAILLQNSWGPKWGISWSDAFAKHYPRLPAKNTGGYVWITYDALRVLGKRLFTIDV